MPNHYTTIAICSEGHDFDCAEFNDRHAKSNLCAIVKPMPEVLESVRVGAFPDGTRIKVEGTEMTEEQLCDQFGTSNWYDWANSHWGTKWGTYDQEAFPLGGDGGPIAIKFQSAWEPPSVLKEIGQWLCRTYNFARVAFVGFEPYDNSTKLLLEVTANPVG